MRCCIMQYRLFYFRKVQFMKDIDKIDFDMTEEELGELLGELPGILASLEEERRES